MKHTKLSRRDLLKLAGLSFGAQAFRPLLREQGPSFQRADALGIVRVAVTEVRVYDEPSYQSNVVATLNRDQLIYVYDKFISPLGPSFNPYWYRMESGYVHTAYLQPVKTQLNEPAYTIKEGGQIAEVTVPLTQSSRFTKAYGWQPLYRLYYQSVHWVTNVGWGPNLTPWYEITDDLLKVTYHVSAKHMRLIPPEEIAPITPEIPMQEKSILVNTKRQSVTAFEGDEVVLHTEVSTGIPTIGPTGNGIPTATPRGNFNVQIKMPVRHMGDGALTSEVGAYELPGVPWVSFFDGTGVAFHGTYWHDNYGNEMSHGCVNMRPEEAKWLWRWVLPVIELDEWHKIGYGTQIFVI